MVIRDGGNKMVEEEKGFIEDREKTITEIELKVNRNNEEQVDKIIFHSADGKITWKPKVTKETFEGGFKVVRQVCMERELLPKKLVEMAQICSEQGSCKAKVAYNWWKTEQDGKMETYRFIQSMKTFDKWEIIKNVVKEESVSP